MKYTLATFMLVLGMYLLPAQIPFQSEMYVNDVPLAEVESNIIEVTVVGRFRHLPRLGLEVNYGQDCLRENNVPRRRCFTLTDAQGEILTYPTQIRALNALDKAGWDLVGTYATDDDWPKYVFKRKTPASGI